MRAHSFVYDSLATPPHVERVLAALDEREESVERIDVDAAETRADGRREAMLTVKEAVRIGSPPDELFDDDGRPDFSVGALVTEEATGRRSLHVGRDALEVLRAE